MIVRCTDSVGYAALVLCNKQTICCETNKWMLSMHSYHYPLGSKMIRLRRTSIRPEAYLAEFTEAPSETETCKRQEKQITYIQ